MGDLSNIVLFEIRLRIKSPEDRDVYLEALGCRPPAWYMLSATTLGHFCSIILNMSHSSMLYLVTALQLAEERYDFVLKEQV